jgi:protein-disulfide isomerase
MNKGFWAIIAVIVVLFGGILFLKNDKANAPDGSGGQPSSHLAGKGTTGVKLVEYGDFQCPYCGQFYPIVKQVQEKYGDQITFQFRHLPLLQIHKNAFAAARASEAASQQGKFWEMYDLIYQNQSTWSEASNARGIFEQYANQLNLDLNKFKTDFASSATNATINADIAEFDKTKLEKSTPTFLLDGKKITPKSVDEFSKAIDAAIASKTKQ